MLQAERAVDESRRVGRKGRAVGALIAGVVLTGCQGVDLPDGLTPDRIMVTTEPTSRAPGATSPADDSENGGQAGRAVVQTEESWRVKSDEGDVLYEEPFAEKNATLCRGKLPGHLLHEWFVVSFDQQPAFDCMAFARANDIEP